MLLLLLRRGAGVAGDLSVSLTESIRLDDVGQGRTELLGAIKVTDGPVLAELGSGNLLTASLAESLKVTDGPPSASVGTGNLLSISLVDSIKVRDLVQVSGLEPGAPVGGPAIQATIRVEVGLHASSFRDTLIDADFFEGCWPLAETRRAVIKDITGHGHHGTLVGTGATPGISNELPEGGLGIRLTGNQYVLIPNAENLSLAFGDIDIVWLFRTTHNSATLRCIACKQETDASGNGWFVGFVNGALSGFLRVSGSTIFNFLSNPGLADGTWHLGHLCYETVPGTVRFFVDGVQSGATVSGVTTEPAVTGADMRIGMFTNGVAGDGSGFIGDLSYITLSREGNQALSSALQPLRLWTNITGDTRSAAGMTISYGISGSSPLDNTASTGECRVALDNSEANSAGLLGFYSLNHANCRTNFRKSSPLRVVFGFETTNYYKHVGRIVTAAPSPGAKLSRLVNVTSVDWMDVAASSRISNVRTQEDIDSDDAIGIAIDEASRPPHAVEIAPGIETFLMAYDIGDGRQETVLSELSRINTSERGYTFIKGDTVQGGVLTSQSRATRQIDTAIRATFNNTMSTLEPEDGAKPNTVLVTVYPRVVGATGVLFSMTARQPIPPGETVEILVDYRDPNQTAVIIGGKSMITPVALTDYTMTVFEDGSSDLTDYCSIAETGADLGGTATSIHVTNTHPSAIGWFMTQLRGTPVRHENPVTTPVFDAATVRREGANETNLDLSYISSTSSSRDIGEHVLALFDAGQIRSIGFQANRSATLMTQALAREPGDRISVQETMQSGSVARQYVINHVTLSVGNGGVIDCEWILAPVLPASQVWVLGAIGQSELGTTTVLGL